MKKQKSKLLANSEIRTGMLMLSPFLILFFVFTILPILSSVVLSFTTYDMISAPKFNGIQNYIKMFSADDMFPKVLRNTLVLAIITGPIGYMLSFILAWMIIWQVLFSGDSYGYVNSALLSLGFISEPIQWFKDSEYVMIIVIVVQLWMSMGISFLANISGLQNVNPEMYEAGCIDGIRNRWAELWYITLPSMKSILLFGAVMQIQSSFSIGSVVTALAGFPSVNYTVDTLVTMLMDVGTSRYEMGYASALSVFLFAMMAITRVVVGKLVDAIGK